MTLITFVVGFIIAATIYDLTKAALIKWAHNGRTSSYSVWKCKHYLRKYFSTMDL